MFHCVLLDLSQEALVNIYVLFFTSARTAKVAQVLPVLINNKALNKARILILQVTIVLARLEKVAEEYS